MLPGLVRLPGRVTLSLRQSGRGHHIFRGSGLSTGIVMEIEQFSWYFPNEELGFVHRRRAGLIMYPSDGARV